MLFVSHNMGAIRSLCNKGIFLDQGKIVDSGDLSGCIARYFEAIGALESPSGDGDAQGEGFGRVHLPDVEGNTVDQGSDLVVATTLRIEGEMSGFSLYCILEDMYGRQLMHLREESTDLGLSTVAPGTYEVRIAVPPLWLNPGLYALHFKALFWGHRSSSRHVSDKFPLDVGGDSSGSESVMHPKAGWSVGRASVLETP